MTEYRTQLSLEDRQFLDALKRSMAAMRTFGDVAQVEGGKMNVALRGTASETLRMDDSMRRTAAGVRALAQPFAAELVPALGTTTGRIASVISASAALGGGIGAVGVAATGLAGILVGKLLDGWTKNREAAASLNEALKSTSFEKLAGEAKRLNDELDKATKSYVELEKRRRFGGGVLGSTTEGSAADAARAQLLKNLDDQAAIARREQTLRLAQALDEERAGIAELDLRTLGERATRAIRVLPSGPAPAYDSAAFDFALSIADRDAIRAYQAAALDEERRNLPPAPGYGSAAFDFGLSIADRDAIRAYRESQLEEERRNLPPPPGYGSGAFDFGLSIADRDAIRDYEATKVTTDAIVELGKAMVVVGGQARLFGASFDVVEAEIEAVRAAIVKSLEEGLDPMSSRVQGLKSRLDELQDIQGLKDVFRDVFGALDSAVGTSVAGVIQGTQTIKGALANMGQSIALSLLNRVVSRGLGGLENLAVQGAGDLVRSFFSGRGSIGYGLSGTSATTSMVPTAVGGFVPALHEGGIVQRPTLALIGEAGPEAVVPLGDRDTLGGATHVEVNVVNQVPGATASAQESRGADGRRVIRVTVRQAIEDMASTGELGRLLGRNYGVTERPVAR